MKADGNRHFISLRRTDLYVGVIKGSFCGWEAINISKFGGQVGTVWTPTNDFQLEGNSASATLWIVLKFVSVLRPRLSRRTW